MTGAVGMYQALPRLSVSSTVCVVTGAVGMYQALPLSVSFWLQCSGPACGAGRPAVQVGVGRP